LISAGRPNHANAPTNHYEVIVVGGGPSGFIAAIAAARNGARTLVIERYGFLGGMATAAALGPISPFHYGDEQVIVGIPQEFVDRMVADGGSTGHLKTTNPHGSGSYLCFFDRQAYKWAAFNLVSESGADVLFHSYLSAVLTDSNRVRGVEVVNKSGKTTYTADIVVDATGDGDVAARADAQFVLGRDGDSRMNPGTLMFDMANVDTAVVKAFLDDHPDQFEWAAECVPLRPFSSHLEQRHFVAQGFIDLARDGRQAGELYMGRDTILFLTTTHRGVLNFNSTRVTNLDGTDAASLTRGEIDGRKQAMSLSQFLVNRVPGFRDAYLGETGIQIGIRETRHILGGYVLTSDDVLSGRKFDDVVARGCFPIDIHSVESAKGYGLGGGVWADLADSYDIPYRCLVPKLVDGILTAGRSISATHEAHGSFRPQGAVMAIGQAAGTAAAVAARHGIQPREVDVRELQECLVADKASLRRDPVRCVRESQAAEAAITQALTERRISGQWIGKEPLTASRAPRL
jgi:hypothetical protein